MNIENLDIRPSIKINGKLNIVIQVDDSHANHLTEMVEAFNSGKNIDCKIELMSKKKTLNANGYLWQLCHKIAVKVGNITKEDVYRQAIKERGIFEQREIENIEAFSEKWDNIGVGFFTEKVSPGIYNSYYGSSIYNRKELSAVIDYVVEEAREQGIETMTIDEQKELLNLVKE